MRRKVLWNGVPMQMFFLQIVPLACSMGFGLPSRYGHSSQVSRILRPCQVYTMLSTVSRNSFLPHQELLYDTGCLHTCLAVIPMLLGMVCSVFSLCAGSLDPKSSLWLIQLKGSGSRSCDRPPNETLETFCKSKQAILNFRAGCRVRLPWAHRLPSYYSGFPVIPWHSSPWGSLLWRQEDGGSESSCDSFCSPRFPPWTPPTSNNLGEGHRKIVGWIWAWVET